MTDNTSALFEYMCLYIYIYRWDIEATEELPDYMKIGFKALYDLTNEISYKVYLKHGWNPSLSLRKAVSVYIYMFVYSSTLSQSLCVWFIWLLLLYKEYNCYILVLYSLVYIEL